VIDWSKLEPYGSDKHRSFEELCCQVAKGLHGHEGRFTSIDDSDGGDGVKFYLKRDPTPSAVRLGLVINYTALRKALSPTHKSLSFAIS
jgi:hypothetical protein